MVMQMNKKEFLEKLSSETGYSMEDTIIINDILERNFVISRKSKDKIITDLINTLKVDEDEANRIYEISSSIIAKAIKNRLIHPFGSNKS